MDPSPTPVVVVLAEFTRADAESLVQLGVFFMVAVLFFLAAIAIAVAFRPQVH